MTQPARLRAVVREIIEHAPGLRSLLLVPERPLPRFRPGQFLQLAVDAWDPSQHWPESRAFSIASPPEQRDELRITFSVVGELTRRMMRLERGAEVWLKLPYGDFSFESRTDTPLVLVAGGTGVTPFVSLLASNLEDSGEIRVLYGARHRDLLVYRDVVESAARRSPQVRCRLFAEEGADESIAAGRFDASLVLAEGASTSAPDRAVYYLAGPPAMIGSLTAGLSGAGVDAGRIRVDAWS